MSESMIERVARILEEKFDGRDGKALPPWKVVAVAAIEAMRAPNSKMCRAAGAAMSPDKRPTQKRVSHKAKHAIRYRAMIAAALQE